jgi:hypothetical protein
MSALALETALLAPALLPVYHVLLLSPWSMENVPVILLITTKLSMDASSTARMDMCITKVHINASSANCIFRHVLNVPLLQLVRNVNSIITF